MDYKTFENRLKESGYPGRGIVIGKTPDGKNLVQIYWIMGRSSNSRNRIFEMDGDFVRTKAYDESKLEDPSLIIYYPAKQIGNNHIITNGDQTDTVFEYLDNSNTFENALKAREYEPDCPNFTPRISGLIDLNNESYKLSILKTIDNNSDYSQKNFYNYENFINGYGHCITTYVGDGNPLPSFIGEPYKVKISNSIEENTRAFWNYLDENNRISLLVKYINIESKEIRYSIVNKNK